MKQDCLSTLSTNQAIILRVVSEDYEDLAYVFRKAAEFGVEIGLDLTGAEIEAALSDVCRADLARAYRFESDWVPADVGSPLIESDQWFYITVKGIGALRESKYYQRLQDLSVESH